MFGWSVKTITVGDLAEKLAHDTPVLIDVREPYEFAEGHVPGAVNVPLGSLASRLGEFDRDAETLLICRSGNRSKTAAARLKRAGFTTVYSVRGGTQAWRGDLVQ